MSEPHHERGAPSRMRFAAGRPARALSDGFQVILIVRKEDRAPVPETVGDARRRFLDDRITRKDRMTALIALDRAMQQAIVA